MHADKTRPKIIIFSPLWLPKEEETTSSASHVFSYLPLAYLVADLIDSFRVRAVSVAVTFIAFVFFVKDGNSLRVFLIL